MTGIASAQLERALAAGARGLARNPGRAFLPRATDPPVGLSERRTLLRRAERSFETTARAIGGKFRDPAPAARASRPCAGPHAKASVRACRRRADRKRADPRRVE